MKTSPSVSAFLLLLVALCPVYSAARSVRGSPSSLSSTSETAAVFDEKHRGTAKKKKEKKNRKSTCKSVGKKKKVSKKKTKSTMDCSGVMLGQDSDEFEDDFELQLLSDAEGAEFTVSFTNLTHRDMDFEDFEAWTSYGSDGEYFQFIKQGSALDGFIQLGNGVTFELSGTEGEMLDVTEILEFEEELDVTAEEDDWWRLRRDLQQMDDRQLQGQDDGSVLDVLVIYTDEVYQAFSGNEGNVEARIAEMTLFTNNAFDNSDIPTQLNVVDTIRLSPAQYTEPSSFTQILYDATFSGGSYSALDFIQAERERVNADFVAMIVANGQYCGIAWLNDNHSPTDERLAYSVTNFGCVTSFAHEIGHNLGLNHNRENANGGTSDTTNANYGYRIPGFARTVLAYQCSPSCTRLPVYSSPDHVFPNTGVTAGDALHNNAQRVKDNLLLYANFRYSGTNPPPTNPPPTNPPPTNPPPTNPPPTNPPPTNPPPTNPPPTNPPPTNPPPTNPPPTNPPPTNPPPTNPPPTNPPPTNPPPTNPPPTNPPPTNPPPTNPPPTNPPPTNPPPTNPPPTNPPPTNPPPTNPPPTNPPPTNPPPTNPPPTNPPPTNPPPTNPPPTNPPPTNPPPTNPGGCSDLVGYAYRGNTRRTCEWAGKRIKFRCDNWDNRINKYVWQVCPESCGSCAFLGCEDDLGYVYKNGNPNRNCQWAGKNPARCDYLDGDTFVYESCQLSCGECDGWEFGA